MILPERYTEAFAGSASRPNSPEVEAYYWDWIVRCAKYGNPAGWQDDVAAINQLPILIIGPAPRDWYWRQVARQKLIAWEGCHGALVGIGRVPGAPLVSVYSLAKLKERFDLVGANRDRLGGIATKPVMDAVAGIWIRKEIVSVDLGEFTPYYIA
jgi:hypothetical protein